MVESPDIQKTGSTIAYCRDLLNTKLKRNINNRQVRSLLIEYYGENICFTYGKDKKRQMFFSIYIWAADFIGSIRNKSLITDIISGTKTLQDETKSFRFQLEGSCCDAEDVATSQLNRKWYVFMKQLCG